MIHVLPPERYPLARVLLRLAPDFLAAQAVAERTANGQIVLDDPAQPRAALIIAGYRYHLIGIPENPAFLAGLRQLFADQLLPALRGRGARAFLIFPEPPRWARHLAQVLPDLAIFPRRYEYWVFQGLAGHWQDLLPQGYALRPADRDLLHDSQMEGLGALREEMCSERSSVEDFLARSFGVVAVKGNELAGWCLSEYNTGGRCEVGIATVESHRRRGVATAMATAFAQEAISRGITHIGWQAQASNQGSLATARRAGFIKVKSYQAHLVLLDPVSPQKGGAS